MTAILSDSSIWTQYIETFDDGDPAATPEIRTPIQGLADRTKYLKDYAEAQSDRLTADEASITTALNRATLLSRKVVFGIPDDLPREESNCGWGGEGFAKLTIGTSGYVRRRWSIGTPHIVAADQWKVSARVEGGYHDTTMPATRIGMRVMVFNQDTAAVLMDTTVYHPGTKVAAYSQVKANLEVLTPYNVAIYTPVLVYASVFGEAGTNATSAYLHSVRLIPASLW